MTRAKPNDRYGLVVAGFAILTALASFLVPLGTLSRSFGGEGALLIHPGRILDFTGRLPTTLPDFSSVTLVTWLLILVLLALAGLAFTRSKWTLVTGVLVIVLTIIDMALFVRAIDLIQAPLLAAGTAYRRLPFRNLGPNLWLFLSIFAGIAAIVYSLAQNEARARAFAAYRSGLVPVIAMLLSIVVGGVVILILQGVPGNDLHPDPLSSLIGKIDLLWFSYSSLLGPALPKFRPSLDLSGIWQSLSLATPLIFSGLGLAFGFRTGLFNIGAPGQIIFGALFATAVGVYIPGPWIIIGPLAVVAAAVGGGLWGAIPGWLKARFGSSEVINTIMLNAVASSVLVFLIGANEYKFFGQTVYFPFKAEGGEAKSAELGAGARLQNMVELFGLRTGQNEITLMLPLALIGAALGWLLSRGDFRRRGLTAGVSAIVGVVLGLILPKITLNISGSMTNSGLNVSFLVSLLAAIFVGVFLWRTAYGFDMRAVGLAPKAAEYGGVNIGRNTILAMAISGALCGLGATHYVLGGALTEYRLKQVLPADIAGFGGITVALLGQNTPVGVILSSLLFGVLGTGGLNLDQALDKVSREIVTVLQALIVLFIATRGFLPSSFFKPAPPPKEADPDKPELEKQALEEVKA
jgi:general nucleoside transport system permease protein